MDSVIRCINLDWLEVFAIERAELDAAYFKSVGYDVKSRQYGTPQYREMFTIFECGVEFLEIRRNPYSIKSSGGIFEQGACHIRLCNRTCYEVSPVEHLRFFMLTHGYRFKAISRVDIALDFQHFDCADITPSSFVANYMNGKFAKVNQSNVAAHGRDWWSARIWNSLKWGSNRSPITTKLYNKTMELREVEDKPYIRERWEECGFNMQADTWRIEFSCNAQMQSLTSLRNGDTFKKNLSNYDTRGKLLFNFRVFMQKYFDFREVLHTRDGRLRRKYECPAVPLFSFSSSLPYKPARNISKSKYPNRTLKILARKLQEIKDDDQILLEYRQAASKMHEFFLQRYALGNLTISEEEVQTALTLSLCHSGLSLSKEQEAADIRRLREKTTMYLLMQKYGIRFAPEGCPF